MDSSVDDSHDLKVFLPIVLHRTMKNLFKYANPLIQINLYYANLSVLYFFFIPFLPGFPSSGPFTVRYYAHKIRHFFSWHSTWVQMWATLTFSLPWCWRFDLKSRPRDTSLGGHNLKYDPISVKSVVMDLCGRFSCSSRIVIINKCFNHFPDIYSHELASVSITVTGLNGLSFRMGKLIF